MVAKRPSKTIDVKGLVCPLPVFKAKKAIVDVGVGEVLEILATDPAAESDIPGWARRAGHELLEMVKEGGMLKFYVRRGS